MPADGKSAVKQNHANLTRAVLIANSIERSVGTQLAPFINASGRKKTRVFRYLELCLDSKITKYTNNTKI